MNPPRWKHQQEGYEFIRSLFARKQYGGMLAMVMGTGKSRVACELATDEKAQQLLIVCPLRVVDVWRQQLHRFAPRYYFVGLDESTGSAQDKTREANRLYAWSRNVHHPVAICVNYDSGRMHPFGSWSATRPWDMVIADESHRLKEPRGRTSKWMAKLGLMARRRLALTGTPMPHQPIDIWAQFRFLNPYHLDNTFGEFKLRYAVMGGYFDKQVVEWRDLDDLERRFRELAFRVDDSVLDLPPEMDEIRSTDLDQRGQRVYRDMEEHMIAWIGDGKCVVPANAMVRLLRLQQLTGGTLKAEDGSEVQVDTAKEILLEELLNDLREPVVVFCRFRADLDAVHRAAERAGLESLELSGERDELKQWQGVSEAGLGRAMVKREGERSTMPDVQADVLAVQIQAGGEGVDLTRARVAIYYSLGFSLKDYLQSRARIRRPPQQRPCVFYHLQIRNSVDEYVLRAVQARRDLVDSVLHELRTKGAANVVAG